MAGGCAGAIQDAAARDDFDCPSVKSARDRGEPEVLCDVHTHELGAAYPLHCSTVDSQRSMLDAHFGHSCVNCELDG